MEQINQVVNLTIALVYILAAGIAVFVALKIGLAEVRKDIQHLTKDLERLEKQLTKISDRCVAFGAKAHEEKG